MASHSPLSVLRCRTRASRAARAPVPRQDCRRSVQPPEETVLPSAQESPTRSTRSPASSGSDPDSAALAYKSQSGAPGPEQLCAGTTTKGSRFTRYVTFGPGINPETRHHPCSGRRAYATAALRPETPIGSHLLPRRCKELHCTFEARGAALRSKSPIALPCTGAAGHERARAKVARSLDSWP